MWFKDKNAFVEKRLRTAADSRELLELHRYLAESFASRAEKRDGSGGGHIKRVQLLTGILTGAMLRRDYPELTAEYADNIVLASTLHDIGKIAVRDDILEKKELTEREAELLKAHTIEGEKILGEISLRLGGGTYIEAARLIAKSHHERWNGCGYPDRLKGGDIPLGARIVSLTDGLDCLVWGEGLTVDNALGALREFSGVYYDPEITDIFISREKEIKEIYEKDRKAD